MSGTILSGTYSDGVVLSDPATQNPATVAASGYISNTASAGIALYGEAGFAWSVANYGTITAPAMPVELASGGIFINRGTVVGFPQAIVISGGPGVVANSGSITGVVTLSGGTGTVTNSGIIRNGGVHLADGGSVTNLQGGSIYAIRTIRGISAPGVVVDGAAGTVANSGSTFGIVLKAGGSVLNAPGAPAGFVSVSGAIGSVTNQGTIVGGVFLSAGGSITNYQGASIAGFGPGATVYGPGILIGGAAGVVTNSGSISDGITIGSLGMVTNSGTISASPHLSGFGVYLAGGGTLANAGAIGGTDAGVVISAGYAPSGAVVNSGRIAGQGAGLVMDDAGSVVNSGIIEGKGATGVGIYLGGPSAPVVINYGVVIGRYGILVGSYETAGATVVNSGAIVGGGQAIHFGAGNNLLVVDPGAVFVGVVQGGGGDTIDWHPERAPSRASEPISPGSRRCGSMPGRSGISPAAARASSTTVRSSLTAHWSSRRSRPTPVRRRASRLATAASPTSPARLARERRSCSPTTPAPSYSTGSAGSTACSPSSEPATRSTWSARLRMDFPFPTIT